MFSKILIANRGEIAVRIIRACKEMGIATVAIYSQADRDALHVALADESYCVGGASPGESYLNEERVVSAALVSGAQAIHPGYGFLSENAHFAALCRKNGLVFIGPSPESMEELSDKARLKEIMGRNGLEVIPGTQVLASAQAALAAAAAGLIVSGYLLLCEKKNLSNGFRKISAAALITLVCILGCHLLDTEASHAIIGALMILTPGIAFTMGIRDFVQGDYLSGTIRMIDALLIAASIAIGTGLVLSLTSILTGVTVV